MSNNNYMDIKNDKMELIYSYIWNPNNSMFKCHKNDKSEYKKYFCNNKNNCDLYKRGHCINLNPLYSCPYGSRLTEKGYTIKARKFNQWIREKQEEVRKLNNVKLSSPPDKMSYFGDYIYLPYSYINIQTSLPFKNKGEYFVTGTPYLNKKDFNIDNIIKIINHKPMAMMGGMIIGYRKKVIPKFLIHLKEFDLNLFNLAVKKIPDILKIVKDTSNIGRKAYLYSLKPNVVINNKGEKWQWDGRYLTCYNSKILFPVVKYEVAKTILTPEKNAIITIDSNDMVDDDTIFID